MLGADCEKQAGTPAERRTTIVTKRFFVFMTLVYGDGPAFQVRVSGNKKRDGGEPPSLPRLAGPGLKRKNGAQLTAARSHRDSTILRGAIYFAEIARAHDLVRKAEAGMVQGIDEICAQRQVESFR